MNAYMFTEHDEECPKRRLPFYDKLNKTDISIINRQIVKRQCFTFAMFKISGLHDPLYQNMTCV